MTRYEELARDIAKQRILYLYRLAVEAVRRGEVEYARKLVEQALTIVKRMRLRKPYVLRRMVCKNCKVPLIPGLTARVRIREGRVVVTCTVCGYIRRYPVKTGRES